MKRVGLQFKVRKDRLAECKEYCQCIWQEFKPPLKEKQWTLI